MSTILIPTEAIGSIPRPQSVVDAYDEFRKGRLTAEELDNAAQEARLETLRRLEQTGSSCVSDGEQSKFSGFAGYCLHGSDVLSSDGAFIIEFEDGHTRSIPQLARGPFRYSHSADQLLDWTIKQTKQPVKQSVISPALLSFIYPETPIPGYSRPAFIRDLLSEHVAEVRRCLDLGAYKVQIDFTEARFSLKIDPSGELLEHMVDLINQALESFTPAERLRIGVHTCPGADLGSRHSGNVAYNDLLPTLFDIDAGSFYVAMTGENDPKVALRLIKTLLRPNMRVFVGVIDPISAEIETPELVMKRIMEAAEYIPVDNLGTTDDCGFAPFLDDMSTSREVAFRKIQARVKGTRMAERELSTAFA